MTLNRIVWTQAGLALAGTTATASLLGRKGALGFVAGALIAAASFWVLHRFVAALGGERPNPLSFVLISVRLMLAGWVLYVILNTYQVHRTALALGIATPVAAITLVALYELLYARSS